MFIKTTSPHEANWRAKRIRNSDEALFCVPCWNFRCHMFTMKKRASCDTFSFFRNHKSCTWNEPWLTCAKHANLFNYPSEKYKLLICSFLEYYCYKIIFVDIILCISKRCLVHDTNVRKVFPALNLAIIFIKFITCIITQPLICNMFFQWNIISPLNFF